MDTPEEINACMEKVYKTMGEDEIPWNRSAAPAILEELVNSGQVQPCKALDIGCGTGNYALFLAKKGFDITGVDVSKSAVKIAQDKAAALNIQARFSCCDILTDISDLSGPFDFIHEWMVLHHILPPERKTYLNNIRTLLAPKGKYLSISFSEADRQFGIPPHGKTRTSILGPTVYCAALDELEDFFRPHFTILTSKITTIPGFKGEHTVNYLFMEKL